MNYFERLNEIDCNGLTESKPGGNEKKLTYLSWAHAWRELKKLFPKSYYTIYENQNEWNYFTDGRYCWVKTGVTVVDDDGTEVEHIEELPVLDYKNKSIPVDMVNSFDINTSIQRSLTKAVARHGLGLYIYAGEDIPNESSMSVAERQAARMQSAKETKETKPRATKKTQPKEVQLTRDEMLIKINALIEAKGLDAESICKRAKIESFEELPDERLRTCLGYVETLEG